MRRIILLLFIFKPIKKLNPLKSSTDNLNIPGRSIFFTVKLATSSFYHIQLLLSKADCGIIIKVRPNQIRNIHINLVVHFSYSSYWKRKYESKGQQYYSIRLGAVHFLTFSFLWKEMFRTPQQKIPKIFRNFPLALGNCFIPHFSGIVENIS